MPKSHKLSRGVAKAPPPLTAQQLEQLQEAIGRHQLGDIAAASQGYKAILAEVPDCFDALHLLGCAAIQQGAPGDGAALIRSALKSNPRQAPALSNLSRALMDMGDGAGALAAVEKSLQIDSTIAGTWYNHGNALLSLRRMSEAVDSFRRALSLQPHFPEALNNLGSTLRNLRQTEEAMACLDQSLQMSPHYADALNNRGLILLDWDRTEEAIVAFRQALAVSPDLPGALNNLGNAYMTLKRYGEAAQVFDHLAAVKPSYPHVSGNQLHAKLQTGDWRDFDSLKAQVITKVDASADGDVPFFYLSVCGGAASQGRCARAFTKQQFPPTPTATKTKRYRHTKIRLAYVSGDFGEHAVTYLLAGVLERHDRQRFETVAISWGRQNEGPLRARIEAAFDHFVDVSALSDEQIYQKMQEMEIDIAVDLTGHTRGNRTGIFARRAAPLQVNFLGLPATMGADYIDYLIADRHLIPEDQVAHYNEKIVWMPDIFQPHDQRPLQQASHSRSALGLPEQGIVLCSFNHTHKLNPTMFAVWMRLLQEVPDAVLWLIATDPATETNLRVQALKHGIAEHRLIFAPRVLYAEHLGRYQHADLFLDTLPFNAGATASDALSQGLPVLTCSGESFAGRMATSLLQGLGLSDLVTLSLADYERKALALLRQPEQLKAFRQRLIDLRESHPYFDTDRYRRHLEWAYEAMHKRHASYLAPQAIQVPSVDNL